jgi:hypothetical protein
MAALRIDGATARLILTATEKVEGVHGDLSAPIAAILDVEVLDDAPRAAGFRAGIKVGTRIPGVLAVGRVVGLHARRFVAVHHDTARGIRVRFEGTSGFDEWIVGSSDPEALADELEAARKRERPGTAGRSGCVSPGN